MFEVHPIAALFPMLPADELKDLADDIAERGLLDPIVVDCASAVLDNDGQVIEGVILDGRNRYAACQIAGVTPQFAFYDSDDLDGFVLAVNIARRHMSKGQRAMVVAQACLVSKQPQREAGAQHGVSASRIAQASTVIKHAPELVNLVVSGAISLDDAYADARARKAKAEEAERLLAQLRDGAPDLADQVIEGQLSAQEAFKAWRDREATSERLERERAETATDAMCHYLHLIAGWPGAAKARSYDPKLVRGGRRPVTMQTLTDAHTVIGDMLHVFRERGLP